MADEHDLKSLPDEYLPAADELPGDLRQVAEIVGVRKTLELVDRFRGTHVYFRNLDALCRKYRDAGIRKDYDQGAKIADLARRSNLCTLSIKKIVNRPEDDNRQQNLF